MEVLTNHKILIVDDNSDVRLLVKRILQQNGYLALTVTNGKEALWQLDKDKDIKLVLLDAMMDVMDGYETLKKIRKSKTYSKTKVCFLTGKNEKSDVLKGVELGADDYIVKPIDASILLEKVSKYFSV